MKITIFGKGNMGKAIGDNFVLLKIFLYCFLFLVLYNSL